MSDSAEAERFRAALEQREEERIALRERLANAASIRDYIDIQRASGSGERQATVNGGYRDMKRR